MKCLVFKGKSRQNNGNTKSEPPLVAKGKEIGNNVASKAKAAGAKTKAAGVAAKSRNRAAYIAGGVGATAGAAGMAMASRKKTAQGDG